MHCINVVNPTPVTIWMRCDNCDHFVCSIHVGKHVADCPCPGIDMWDDINIDPYTSPITLDAKTWVEQHPFFEEE